MPTGRQLKAQHARIELGLCRKEGCPNKTDGKHVHCEYHLNLAMVQKKPTRHYTKTSKRLLEQNIKLESFLLRVAGFKTREDAIKIMYILDLQG